MERAWEQTRREEEDRVRGPGEDDDFDLFFRNYLDVALMDIHDEEGDFIHPAPDEERVSDETMAKLREDCWKFFRENRNDCLIDVALAGSDFWMTRQGAGVGFWEHPDWPREPGQRLYKAAKKFGEFDLYLGDDGQIWH